MVLKLKPYLLFILLPVLFYSCQKEYSYEGNVISGTAVFSLNGSPGPCTNAIVTGIYEVGTPLAATNIATISVAVTTTGTYTISTAAVNGISFSGSGTFTSTGAQTISLTGTGTPTSAGTFSFTPGTTGCAFPVTVTSGGGSSGSAVFTLNGAPNSCASFTPGGTYTAGTPLVATNVATVSVNVTTIGTYTINTNAVNGISFSASGSFTTTGTQALQLAGLGTPLAAGTFDYTPGTNGCTFPITVTGGSSGPAVFTYGGAPNACTSAVIAGTYTAGTPLTASNTVVINVNVTTAGTYTVSTSPVNGISFTGTGSFAAVGANTVTLIGSGTPAAAGLFNYTPSNNGCSFPITVLPGVVLTDFLTCTIDGVVRNFNVGLSAIQITSDTIDLAGAETSAASSPLFEIILRKSPLITTGIYNQYTPLNTSVFCGAFYVDTSPSSPWISGLSPLLAGFTVNVTNYSPVRIRGTFSGTIYSDPVMGTGPMVITNGTFSVPF